MRRTLLVICIFFLGLFCTSAQIPADAPIVAPGLRVPGTAIPYALDEYNGKQELVPIHHSTINVNRHLGANFAGSAAESFLYRRKMTTELEGQHARVELHSFAPIFYLHVDEDPDHSGDGSGSYTEEWVLQHLAIFKNHRRVSKITTNGFGGQAKRDDGRLDIKIEKLPGSWIRVTPGSPLAPGEYALSAVPNKQAFFSTVVYDFGIDPNAPEAKEAISADRTTP